MNKALILIPARYQSSRFPGKPLKLIHDKSMIERVALNMKESGFDFSVVTDHDEIEKHLKLKHIPVVRIDDDVPSGSERIALAFERYFSQKGYDFIVNVQGDEPLLKGSRIKDLVDFHQQSTFDITTMMKPRQDVHGFKNPDIVKVVVSKKNQCLYFSRASIPFDRDESKQLNWYQHIGIYCYRVNSLREFLKYPLSSLEDREKLEQLRALENDQTIGALVCSDVLIGVDQPSDIAKVEEVLNVQAK